MKNWMKNAFKCSILGLAAIGLSGVSGASTANTAANPKSQSLLEYGEMCAKLIGQVPAFDCTKGTVVPITVDGKEPSSYTKGMKCDRPSLLEYKDPASFGQCTPYSKIQDLSYEGVQISAFCRREFLRPEESPFYDEVDVILHSQKTGATCWFHAEYKEGSNKGFDASRVPPPNEKKPPSGKVAAKDFWWQPARTATKDCGGCHDADPFMFSPWIGQTWQKVPSDPLGKYHHLGPDFAAWHSSSISTRDNTCTGCHRIGNQESCRNFIEFAAGLKQPPGGNTLANSYPLSHWMPVNNTQSREFWSIAHANSVSQLLTCCKDPKNPICTITPLTGAARPGKTGKK